MLLGEPVSAALACPALVGRRAPASETEVSRDIGASCVELVSQFGPVQTECRTRNLPRLAAGGTSAAAADIGGSPVRGQCGVAIGPCRSGMGVARDYWRVWLSAGPGSQRCSLAAHMAR